MPDKKKILMVSKGFVTDEDRLMFLNPIQWFLQLKHQSTGQSKDRYEWLLPVLYFENTQTVLNQIVTASPDVLVLSVYAWNREALNEIADNYKKHRPDSIVIVGGPDIDAHKNKKFFEKHPYVDYAIYGDGEEIFSDLLDKLVGYQVGELCNLVEPGDGEPIVHTHKVFKDKDVLSQSPYLTFSKELTATSDLLRQEYPDLKQCIVWETVKGCPYKCSYCDWSAGLHNKVRSWKDNAHAELDLFSQLKFEYIEWTNPNYGLMKEDVDIATAWAQLYHDGEWCPKAFSWNFAKLDKRKSMEIFKLFVDAKIAFFLKFDVQDADMDVLKLNDRPEQPMEELLPLMKRVAAEYPDLVRHERSRINYILGLPGQTFNSFIDNLKQSFDVGLRPNHFALQLVPNSPAGDPLFKRLHKLETRTLVTISKQFSTAYIGESDIENSELENNRNLDAVVSTRYLNSTEWVSCMLMDLYIKSRWYKTPSDQLQAQILANIDYFKSMAEPIVQHNTNKDVFILGTPADGNWLPIKFKELA
jgi:putative methyltransferase